MQNLTVCAVQADLHWENKEANLLALEEQINQITGQPELILLPEMFSTGFSMNPVVLAEDMAGKTVEWMKRVAAQNKAVLAGSIIVEEQGYYFNRLIWMQPNGVYGIYDKRHLFAFGEEDKYYHAGDKRLIASLKGWKINLQICYDLRFPVWARQQSGNGEAEYDLLVYVANWPRRRQHAWITLLQARAIENQCYVVGVNRVGKDGNDIDYAGDTVIIDPLGEILVRCPEKVMTTCQLLDWEYIRTTREKFPFLRDGDPFALLK